MTLAEQFREEGRTEGLQKGLQNGLQDGLKKGRAETIRAIARTMLSKNMSIELITELTGLDIGAVYALKKKEA